MYFRTLLVALWCLAMPMEAYSEAQPGYSDTIYGGVICVNSSRKQADVIADIVQLGGKARATQQRCEYVRGIEIRVPLGLERWTILTLQKNGYRSVAHQLGSAGGDTMIKRRVQPTTFFTEEVTPSNIGQHRARLEKLFLERLRNQFSDVSLGQCRDQDLGRELCWVFWAAGHTSHSTGLPAKCTQGTLSSHYWYSTKFSVELSNFSQYRDNGGKNLGYLTRIDVDAGGAKFARRPASQKPEPNHYRDIKDFEPKADDYGVYVMIGSRISRILTNEPDAC